MAFGQVLEQPLSKCPKKRPKAIKTCNAKHCRNPILELRKVIHQSKQNKESNKIDENIFVQKNSEQRLSLKVTGEAIVTTGTILRLRCPRRKTDKISDKTQWLKNNAKISFSKRLKMSAKNVLRIKSVEISDSGIYSCSWDNTTYHSINLQIRRLTTSDEDKTVERPKFESNIGLNNYDFGKVIIESEESDRSHGASEERRQTLMRVKPKRANRRPKNVAKDLALSEELSAESGFDMNGGQMGRQMDSFEVNYGHQNKEQSDQNIPNVNKDIDENSEEKFRGEHKKDDSVSQLRKLMTDLTKQMKTNFNDFPKDSEFKVNFNRSTQSKSISNYKQLLSGSQVLETEKTNDLKFNWMTTEWSTCTVSCGGTGYQVFIVKMLKLFGQSN